MKLYYCSIWEKQPEKLINAIQVFCLKIFLILFILYIYTYMLYICGLTQPVHKKNTPSALCLRCKWCTWGIFHISYEYNPIFLNNLMQSLAKSSNQLSVTNEAVQRPAWGFAFIACGHCVVFVMLEC